MYALCITPELSIEHIYWGTQLHNEFDLRYLSQSSRMTPFVTSEESVTKMSSNTLSTNITQAETLEDLQETWRRSKISSFGRQFEESEYIKKKRLENLSWRAMAIKLFTNQQLSPNKLQKIPLQQAKSNPVTPRVLTRGSEKEFLTPTTRALTRQRSYTATTSGPGPLSPKSRVTGSVNDFKKTFPTSTDPITTSTSLKTLNIPIPPIPPRFDNNVMALQEPTAVTTSLQPTARATFDRIRGKIGKG